MTIASYSYPAQELEFSMFEELSPLSKMQIREICSELPILVRHLFELTHAVESRPCTQQEAERATDDAIRRLPQIQQLLREDLPMREIAPRVACSQVQAVMEVCESHALALIGGSDTYPRIGELAASLRTAIKDAQPFVGSDTDLEAAIEQIVVDFNELQRSIYESLDAFLKYPHQVKQDEAQRLLAMSPEDAQAHHDLGVAYATQGRLSEALPELQRAYDLSPETPHYPYFLAKCLFDLGRADDALLMVEKAVTLNRSNGAVWYLLGQVQLARGMAQEAADALLRVDAMASNEADSDHLLAQLSIDPKVNIPRPEPFVAPTRDERFSYGNKEDGPMGVYSTFRIRLWERGPGNLPIVLASWDARSEGRSLTNGAEALAAAVGQHLGFSPGEYIWIEHYERGFGEVHSLKIVSFNMTGWQFDRPTWLPLTQSDFETYTGFRLSWRPWRTGYWGEAGKPSTDW